MERNVLFSAIWFATLSTSCGSESSMSMDAGRGFMPSSESTISEFDVARNFSRACSFVVNETDETPSIPLTKPSTAWMSASDASSAT